MIPVTQIGSNSRRMAHGRTNAFPALRMKKFLFLAVIIVFATGCQQWRFYRQAIAGHLDVLSHRQPIRELIEASTTPPKLREQLQLVLQLRDFARDSLALPVDGHYLDYADLNRAHVVWNVHAAPPLSIEPRKWFYPLVGRLSYRGYFRETDAESAAEDLRSQGYDTYVGGVAAYSTLGWFRDPVLNTFVNDPEPDLAELIFHELAHQKLFVSGDTDFNEAFATAVGEAGVHRWLSSEGRSQQLDEYSSGCRRRDEFANLVMNSRARLKAVYPESSSPKSHTFTPPDGNLLKIKEGIISDLRKDYDRQRQSWNGSNDYAGWFAGPINNAKLNTIESYHRLVPAFRQLQWESRDDLPEFYAKARILSKLPKQHRQAQLAELAGKFHRRTGMAKP